MNKLAQTTKTRVGRWSWIVVPATCVVIALVYVVYRSHPPSSPDVGVSASETPGAVEDLVRAELHADVETIVPGRSFTAGVFFTIKPGWHIYWSDPGDAGLPTTVEFELPAGFSVGALQYPKPIEFVQPGNIVGHGYTGRVLLSAKIKPPDDLAANSRVVLRARAQWLACAERCIPGSADLELELAMVSEGTAQNVEPVVPK